jgi:coenzyme PQQ precursor peptide PqqA
LTKTGAIVRASWLNIRPHRAYIPAHRRSAGLRRDPMVWKTPKIVEIVCGAEINAYVSAEIA